MKRKTLMVILSISTLLFVFQLHIASAVDKPKPAGPNCGQWAANNLDTSNACQGYTGVHGYDISANGCCITYYCGDRYSYTKCKWDAQAVI
ncbi:MAG TPA: hypothetical protein VGB16_00090 [candidate division Zixibacteria bacterium]